MRDEVIVPMMTYLINVWTVYVTIKSPRLMTGFVVGRSEGDGRSKCITRGSYSDVICVKELGFRTGKEKGQGAAGKSQKDKGHTEIRHGSKFCLSVNRTETELDFSLFPSWKSGAWNGKKWENKWDSAVWQNSSNLNLLGQSEYRRLCTSCQRWSNKGWEGMST